MATKTQALAVAKKFGFVLDDSVSGKFGLFYLITFDHKQSIGGDCRSIHVEDIEASAAWKEAIERMNDEAPLLTPCTDENCEYHHGE